MARLGACSMPSTIMDECLRSSLILSPYLISFLVMHLYYIQRQDVSGDTTVLLSDATSYTLMS